ncbi:MBL fold metallo-hydrolase [Actibacterium pelagium]|uniref:MBL fold hydrolase n=1 Tax=Actibacterium pelagium TaxID=2029103 RepID=A0A917AEY1_9RHOB|nr:MBL fold metallo-hydrolase [Actibacterium pelagium]GGE43578.1 MBL fold hydrolase [Actibacterium pelagium]
MTTPYETGEVTWINDLIRLVLAPNPSPMTFWGTNTYLLGRGEVTVVDPGPSDPAHTKSILSALEAGERITRIFLTHSHLDHSAGVPALVTATGAQVLAYGDSLAGRRDDTAALEGLGGGEGRDRQFAPDVVLKDDQIIEGDNWSATAIWTPGHMGNHLCFGIGEDLLSGDHIMGWATSMVSPPDGDLTDFMASLEKLMGRQFTRLLPAHGAPVADAEGRLQELHTHRKTREGQILSAVHDTPGTAQEFAQRIYTETPAALIPAATRNVLAHLIDLSRRGLVTTEGHLTETSIFSGK